ARAARARALVRATIGPRAGAVRGGTRPARRRGAVPGAGAGTERLRPRRSDGARRGGRGACTAVSRHGGRAPGHADDVSTEAVRHTPGARAIGSEASAAQRKAAREGRVRGKDSTPTLASHEARAA